MKENPLDAFRDMIPSSVVIVSPRPNDLLMYGIHPVSYTHLDVYKRQVQ